MSTFDISGPGRIERCVRNPHYLVGDDGSVYREQADGRLKPLKPWLNGDGRPYVELYRRGRKPEKVEPGILVMEAFVGPKPDGLMVLHGDDDPTHNHLANLRYGDARANYADAVRNGKIELKLTVEEVTLLRVLRRAGADAGELARMFAVSLGYVYKLARGEHRRDVPMPS